MKIAGIVGVDVQTVEAEVVKTICYIAEDEVGMTETGIAIEVD